MLAAASGSTRKKCYFQAGLYPCTHSLFFFFTLLSTMMDKINIFLLPPKRVTKFFLNTLAMLKVFVSISLIVLLREFTTVSNDQVRAIAEIWNGKKIPS